MKVKLLIEYLKMMDQESEVTFLSFDTNQRTCNYLKFTTLAETSPPFNDSVDPRVNEHIKNEQKQTTFLLQVLPETGTVREIK